MKMSERIAVCMCACACACVCELSEMKWPSTEINNKIAYSMFMLSKAAALLLLVSSPSLSSPILHWSSHNNDKMKSHIFKGSILLPYIHCKWLPFTKHYRCH